MLAEGTLASVLVHWICMYQGLPCADGAWLTYHSGLYLLLGSLLF